jgi:hypothetical protein
MAALFSLVVSFRPNNIFFPNHMEDSSAELTYVNWGGGRK